ncbi:unnamed protein product [Phytophthora fragariaefolia]|uniref:Unnamed protein product n=1 Tax=Phytophthora fragariaefolia TaxID=1490495 RepID=A0A9W7D6L3_9STRA|nr:unnamed protein product [Phytophthora fragariaefolia]
MALTELIFESTVTAFLEVLGCKEMSVYRKGMYRASEEDTSCFMAWQARWEGWKMGFTHFVQLQLEPVSERRDPRTFFFDRAFTLISLMLAGTALLEVTEWLLKCPGGSHAVERAKHEEREQLGNTEGEQDTKRLGNSMLLPKSGRVALHICINTFSPKSTSWSPSPKANNGAFAQLFSDSGLSAWIRAAENSMAIKIMVHHIINKFIAD